MIRSWLSGGAVAAAVAVAGAPMSRAQDAEDLAPLPRPAELTAPEADAARFGEADLDALAAPIALYPDALLTQIFVAATYPLDVVKADRFVAASEGMSDKDRAAAAEREPWDPSVQLLAGGFPTVIRMMGQDLDWTEQLGDAVIAQTEDLLDAVQRLRAQAAAAGNLETNDAQVVEVDDGAISVSPADPEVVYVPSYDPALAFAPAAAPVVVQESSGTSDLLVMGAVSFGTALLVNEIFDDDDDWDDYWGPGPAHIDWDDADFYPRRDVDIDGDVNIDIDRTRIDGEGGRIGDIDREELRQDRRELRREAGGWEPTAEQRERAQANIERRQGDRAGEGRGAAAAAAAAGAAGGLAGGALAARSQGGGEARARLEAANAKRPPQQKFEGASSALQARKDTPVRAAKQRERAAASLDRPRAASAKARPEAAPRSKSMSKPAQVKKPVRKPPQASSAFKQHGGARAKASSHRGARSAGGRGGGGHRGRR